LKLISIQLFVFTQY